MATEYLQIRESPQLSEGKLVLAFGGWMDGGDVSTGSLEWLVNSLEARRVARIAPESFYIYNFPGSMEISALFRPHTKIEDGEVKRYKPPANTFYCDEGKQLLLFSGKEPHYNWSQFAECIFSYASQVGVQTIYFVGSFAGMVPHTRGPRLTGTVSDEDLKPDLEQYGIHLANYEGPASFSTYMMTRVARYGMRMLSLVAEIPAYIQGTNPKCIETVVRTLSAVVGIQFGVDRLREMTDEWEKRLTDAIQDKDELVEHIGKLEEDYDNEVFDTQMEDLKIWLENQGIRVD